MRFREVDGVSGRAAGTPGRRKADRIRMDRRLRGLWSQKPVSSAMRLRAFMPTGAIAFVLGLSTSSPRWLHTRVATWSVIRMHAGVAWMKNGLFASWNRCRLGSRWPRINSECSRLKTPPRQRAPAVTFWFFVVPSEDRSLKSIMRGKWGKTVVSVGQEPRDF